jgi:hypothetical protein
MTRERNRRKQTETLSDRLARFSGEARQRAEKLPPGPERDAEMKKIAAADTAAKWANSTELTRPE